MKLYISEQSKISKKRTNNKKYISNKFDMYVIVLYLVYKFFFIYLLMWPGEIDKHRK